MSSTLQIGTNVDFETQKKIQIPFPDEEGGRRENATQTWKTSYKYEKY